MQRFIEDLKRSFGDRVEMFINAVLPGNEGVIEESLFVRISKLAQGEIKQLLGYVPDVTVQYDPRRTRHGAFIVHLHPILSEKYDEVAEILVRNGLSGITPRRPKIQTPGMIDIEGMRPHRLEYPTCPEEVSNRVDALCRDIVEKIKQQTGDYCQYYVTFDGEWGERGALCVTLTDIQEIPIHQTLAEAYLRNMKAVYVHHPRTERGVVCRGYLPMELV